MVEVDRPRRAVLGARDEQPGAGLAGHPRADRRRVGQHGRDDVARADLHALDVDRVGRVEAELVEHLEHGDHLLAQAVLEGHAPGIDPSRHEQDLLVLDVDALHRPDPLGEVEDLRIGEGRQRREARLDVTAGPLALPHHRWVEALLDDRPHRKAGGEDLVAVVVVDDEVGPVAGAELVDLVEELVRRVAGEDIGQSRLDPDAEQRQPARRLPLPCLGQLQVAELDPGQLVRPLRVRRGQRHRHVEVVGPGGERPVEDRHDEARVDGVEDVRRTVLAGQGRHGRRVGGVDLRRDKGAVTPPSRRRCGNRRLGPLQRVVGHHPQLEEVALGGDLGRRVTDPAGTDHEHTHESLPTHFEVRLLATRWPTTTSRTAMTKSEKPMTLAWAGMPRR